MALTSAVGGGASGAAIAVRWRRAQDSSWQSSVPPRRGTSRESLRDPQRTAEFSIPETRPTRRCHPRPVPFPSERGRGHEASGPTPAKGCGFAARREGAAAGARATWPPRKSWRGFASSRSTRRCFESISRIPDSTHARGANSARGRARCWRPESRIRKSWSELAPARSARAPKGVAASEARAGDPRPGRNSGNMATFYVQASHSATRSRGAPRPGIGRRW